MGKEWDAIKKWAQLNFGQEPIFVEVPVEDPAAVPPIIHVPVKKKPNRKARRGGKKGK